MKAAVGIYWLSEDWPLSFPRVRDRLNGREVENEHSLMKIPSLAERETGTKTMINTLVKKGGVGGENSKE